MTFCHISEKTEAVRWKLFQISTTSSVNHLTSSSVVSFPCNCGSSFLLSKEGLCDPNSIYSCFLIVLPEGFSPDRYSMDLVRPHNDNGMLRVKRGSYPALFSPWQSGTRITSTCACSKLVPISAWAPGPAPSLCSLLQAPLSNGRALPIAVPAVMAYCWHVRKHVSA